MASSIILPSARQRALRLMGSIGSHSSSCPCHANTSHTYINPRFQTPPITRRKYATPVDSSKEYAFEMAMSSIRFGEGCTLEVGMDVQNMGIKKVLVLTDPTVAKLLPMKNTIQSLEEQGVNFEIFDKVRIEPKDYSLMEAIKFARESGVDGFVAVGGGSVIDTAKIANLYVNHPEAEFLDFVNAPLGKGLPVQKILSPLIAIPTTAGTGSETTGTAIFDFTSAKVKTGIAHRALKPTLGLIDPLNTRSMPSSVHTSTGLDVLCHALESWTAIPYYERVPRPKNPILRPAYQGANPISDIWSMHALKECVQYLPRAAKDPEDHEAQSRMLFAATAAGIGFGNAGVHLCHGMSYPISGNNKKYRHPGYEVDHPLVPHGVSVAVTAPSVFSFTGAANPARHLQAAAVFGKDVSNAKESDAGTILSDAIREFLLKLGDQPRGIKEIGYERSDIPALVEGTLPQRRVLDLAPNHVVRDDLQELFENALTY